MEAPGAMVQRGAGSLSAAIQAKRFVHEASVTLGPFTAGHVALSQSAVPPELSDEKPECDRSTAARIVLTPLDTCPRWKAIPETVRSLRRRAEEIIEENWVKSGDRRGARET
jgi:hypothetical protein